MSEFFGDSVYESGDAVDDSDWRDPLDDLSGDDADEQDQTGYDPPDREPYGLRHVPTALDDAYGESLDQRLAEEEPDIDEAVTWSGAAEPRAGRIVAPGYGAVQDPEAESIGFDVGTAGYAASAEEAAMHVIDPN